jgi:hypothetical protein
MADVAIDDRYLLKTMNMRRDGSRVASAAPRPSRARAHPPLIAGWATLLAIGAIVAACGASPAIPYPSAALDQSSIALASWDSLTPSSGGDPAVDLPATPATADPTDAHYQDATSGSTSPGGSASLDMSADATSLGSVAIPSSIDATGKTDASAALTAFFKSVPAGSTIQFKADGVYRMDIGLVVTRRDNLVLEGNGATLKSTGDWSDSNSLITLRSATRITIRDLKLVGNNPTPGVYHPAQEWAHGIHVSGGSNIDISGVTTGSTWGDCLHVSAWADSVSFRDSTCLSAGRHGVAITAGRNVTVQRCSFGTIGYGALDIEPNASTDGAVNIKFLDNSIAAQTGVFFAANGAAGSTVSDVTVDGNTVSGGTLRSIVTLARRSNIVFTNNVSSMEGAGPLLNFSHIDGLTVTGNVEPLTSEPLLAITDCTNVVAQPDATTVLEMSVIMSPQAAGVANSVTVTAKDAQGNVSAGYRGTIRIKSSDLRATLPPIYTFTAADAGVHVFSGGLTFRTLGTQWVRVYDRNVDTIFGLQSGIVVIPGPAATFVVSTSATFVAGDDHTVTVTARDICGNTATGYRGRVHFTSSDSKAIRPANYTFTAADAGVHMFDHALTMRTATIQSVTVTDTVQPTVAGFQTGIVITPAAATTVLVFTSMSFVVGVPHTVTVTAKDAYGNTAKGYRGTIHFTSSDSRAVLPADYTFTAADAGTHWFSKSVCGITFKTAGTRSVTATDTVTVTITGSQTGIVVTA